jgi:hypothetical protein
VSPTGIRPFRRLQPAENRPRNVFEDVAAGRKRDFGRLREPDHDIDGLLSFWRSTWDRTAGHWMRARTNRMARAPLAAKHDRLIDASQGRESVSSEKLHLDLAGGRYRAMEVRGSSSITR